MTTTESKRKAEAAIDETETKSAKHDDNDEQADKVEPRADRKERYDAIMKRAGEEWSEHAYFILCEGFKVHVTHDARFMGFYHKAWNKCKDEELKKMVTELKDELEKDFRALAWFVEDDHFY